MIRVHERATVAWSGLEGVRGEAGVGARIRVVAVAVAGGPAVPVRVLRRHRRIVVVAVALRRGEAVTVEIVAATVATVTAVDDDAALLRGRAESPT